VLKRFYRDRPMPEPWGRPDGLTRQEVDEMSGQRATSWCPADSVYTEHYLSGTEPQAPCDLHGPWSGGEIPDSLPRDSVAVDSLSAPTDEDFEY